MRASLGVLISAALLTGVTSVVTAPAAVADDYVPSKTLTRASWGYTDAGTPGTGHPGAEGEAPVGTWIDNRWHVGRSYFTFDIGEFKDRRILSASVSGRETHAADCERRAIELWRTDPYTGQSWRNRPNELEKLGSAGKPDTGCVVENVTFDIASALRDAVARGESTLTLALRVAHPYEYDRRYHRRFANDLKLAIVYNTPPATPTGLWNMDQNKRDCATSEPGPYLHPRANAIQSLVLGANVSDADTGDTVLARFATWPVSDPANKRELEQQVHGDSTWVNARNADLAEGTYAWQVRAEDGTDVSEWSQTCYFIVDRIAPAKPGAVGDVYYESQFGYKGAPGTPGTFTFTPNGSDDVVEYEYTIHPQGSVNPKRVPADGPGLSAKITWAPEEAGHHYLYVHSIDRAGLRSQTGGYTFYVRENRPTVWSTTYPAGDQPRPEGGVGIPGVFDFTPGMPEVVEYTYRLEDGPEQTVAARADGKASATITPTKGGTQNLYVANKSRSGEQSIARRYPFRVDDFPVVTHDGGQVIPIGTDVNITFAPKALGVTEYEYTFGWGSPWTKVAAGADGKATVVWRAVSTSYHTLRVRSISGTSAPTEERQVSLYVDGAVPTVVREGAEKPGETGQLTFSTTMRNPVSYTYWTDEDATKRTSPVGADGKLTVPWTPQIGGWHYVYVFATNAAGVKTEQKTQSLLVVDNPIMSSADFKQGLSTGRFPGTIEFSARQVNVKEFVYSINSGPEVVVPANAEGKATLNWTPPDEVEYYSWTVYSRDTQGRKSTNTYYQFSIGSQPKITSTDFPEYEYGGQPGVEGTFTFLPDSFDVAEYVWTIETWEGEETGTVTAGPDGKATLRWTPTQADYHRLTVRSRSSDGQWSLDRYYTFHVGS